MPENNVTKGIYYCYIMLHTLHNENVYAIIYYILIYNPKSDDDIIFYDGV